MVAWVVNTERHLRNGSVKVRALRRDGSWLTRTGLVLRIGEAVEGLAFAKNGVEVTRLLALRASKTPGASVTDGFGGQVVNADGGQRAARPLG